VVGGSNPTHEISSLLDGKSLPQVANIVGGVTPFFKKEFFED